MHELYQEVRNIREQNNSNNNDLESIFNTTLDEYPNDWLLPLEIYELVYQESTALKNKVLAHLKKLTNHKEIANLIEDGLKLLELELEKMS